jgi:hypothetical protein
VIIFATRWKKQWKVLQKDAKVSLLKIKKNFAKIKRPLTFAPRSKKSGGSNAERSLKVWKQQHSDILDIGGKF